MVLSGRVVKLALLDVSYAGSVKLNPCFLQGSATVNLTGTIVRYTNRRSSCGRNHTVTVLTDQTGVCCLEIVLVLVAIVLLYCSVIKAVHQSQASVNIGRKHGKSTLPLTATRLVTMSTGAVVSLLGPSVLMTLMSVKRRSHPLS